MVTLIFIVFFFTIIELPAMLILGFWFFQQVLFGYFDLDTGGERGRRGVLRPHRRLRLRVDRDQAVRGRAQAAAAAGAPRSSSHAHRSSPASRWRSPRCFGFLTLFVIFENGPDVLSVISLLVLAMFFFGIFGALGQKR